jgi:hypothetical protein
MFTPSGEGKETPIFLGSFSNTGHFLRDPTEKVSESPHLKMKTNPISGKSWFPLIYNSGRWTKSRSLVILCYTL